MIIGNGLIANAFSESKINREDIIIFASGISNSNDNSIKNCIREKRKVYSLKKYRDSKLIIYFSTISVCDPSQKNRLYIKHKLNMEKYIKNFFENYLIIRLPIVIGKSKNKNTLINNFVTCINENQKIYVFSNAVRYFIDLEDVVYVTEKLIKKRVFNKTVSAVFNNKLKINELVDILFSILNKETDLFFLEKGADYNIKKSITSYFFDEKDIRNSKQYVIDTLNKYLK